MPLFVVPGDGRYPVQPIHVDDLARICLEAARGRSDVIVDAAGPETMSFEELVRAIRDAVGQRTPILHAPPAAMAAFARTRLCVRDVVLTADEIRGLTAGLLTSHQPALGQISFLEVAESEWVNTRPRIRKRAGPSLSDALDGMTENRKRPRLRSGSSGRCTGRSEGASWVECADVPWTNGPRPRHLPFRRAALSFMRWQERRGVLNPLDASPPGSVWWRAVNEGLLRDGCESVALVGGMAGVPSSQAVRLWLEFIARPTARNWYRAHNASIVGAYLEHRDSPKQRARRSASS